ncbi:hypothetical protein Trydic_g23807 [Trypoxylus dichotomus]
MSFLRGTEEYYQKFLELQEKLRKSEEERLLLEMKFNEMVQATREEEQAHYRKLRNQYKRFLEEDQRRQERNERIMRILERIESRAAILAAKTERFELLRQQYQAYLQRVFSNMKHTHETNPQIPKVTTTVVEEQPGLYGHPVSEKTIYEDEFDNVTRAARDLYEHPVIKKALAKNKRAPLDSKLDVVKQYLRSLSSPISGDEILKTTRSSGKGSSVHTSDHTDSNGTTSYRDDVEVQEYRKNNAGKIADQIMNSINSRPRYSAPYYDGLNINTHSEKQDRDRLHQTSFCGTTLTPKQTISKNADYVEVFNNEKILEDGENFITKDKEATKKAEVRFQDIPVNKDDTVPGILKTSQEITNEYSTIPEMTKEVEDGGSYQLQYSENDIKLENIKNYDISQDNDNEIHDTYKDQDAQQLECVDATLSDQIEWKREETTKDFITENEVEDTVEEIEEKLQDTSDFEEKEYAATTADTPYDETLIQEEHRNAYEEDQEQVENFGPIAHEDQEYYQKDDYPTDYQEVVQPLAEYDPPISHDAKSANSQQIKEEQSLNSYNVKQPLQTVQNNDETDQLSRENIAECEDSNQSKPHYNENEQQQLRQDTMHYPTAKYEDNQHYSESGPPAMQFEESQQPTSQYNMQQEVQYDEKGQIIMQYDEQGQPVAQYNEPGQPVMQYDETGHSIMQYDENGQPTIRYDQNDQPIIQYDQTGQPIMQYDENGQPIVHYDQHGQPILQYDENEQLIMQYDENGQPLLQYDENGQPILGYDENGQPIMHYDENGQPIIYDGQNQLLSNFDVNGQPLYQYEQSEEYYAGNQMYNEQYQNVIEDASKKETVSKEELSASDAKQQSLQQNSPSNEQKSNVIEKPADTHKQQALKQNSPSKDTKHNVMDMLDTDTESMRQDTKVSNDSDFDFSNN